MGTNLRLNRIRVKNLFERFTYDINLDNGENIAILIAPNGCGKTTIFNLVCFMFKPSLLGYRNIVNVPFDSCECTLSNGRVVTLKRKVATTEGGNTNDVVAMRMQNRTEVLFGIRTREDVSLSLAVKGEKVIDLTKEIRNILSHMDPDMPFVDDEDFEGLDWDDLEFLDLPPRYRMQLRRSPGFFANVKEYLVKNECNFDINFIRADRLHRPVIARDSMYSRRRSVDAAEQNPLVIIQNKTKKLYKDITDEYNNLQRDMKDRLPKMYLDMDSNSATMDFDTFKCRWSEYLSNIEKYCEIGLLASKQTVLEMGELADAFNKRKAFLTVYLEAFEKTLEPLERHYIRLKLFVDILNRRNRVTRKVMTYGENGVIVTVDGKQLPLDCLSSGEKNDFIMFYNLIFGSEMNGLVLVDEPEISLHIEWQEEYLDCLIKICEMNSLQAIVATHSPNIVNGHFELYAERGLTDGC